MRKNFANIAIIRDRCMLLDLNYCIWLLQKCEMYQQGMAGVLSV